jgi:hypothetical protein
MADQLSVLCDLGVVNTYLTGVAELVRGNMFRRLVEIGRLGDDCWITPAELQRDGCEELGGRSVDDFRRGR